MATTGMAMGGGLRQNSGSELKICLKWKRNTPVTVLAVAFFPALICIHKQTIKTGLATAGMKMGGGLQRNSGGELKTLPRLYRILAHLCCLCPLHPGGWLWVQAFFFLLGIDQYILDNAQF